MPRPIRRVVTGHTLEGRSTIIMDGPAPQVNPTPDPAGGSTNLWTTDRSPATNEGDADMAPAGVRLPIAPRQRGGSVFRVVDFLPSSRTTSHFSTSTSGVEQSAERTVRHPGFHRSDTVDYAIVLEGEVWALLDDAETLLRAGDVLIQRGTFHAWDNRSEQVCRVAFVLLDAEPLSLEGNA